MKLERIDPTIFHIGLCADDKFALPLGVCITSILETNKHNKFCFHIITNGFSKSNLEKLNKLILKYGNEILIYEVDDKIFDELPTSNLFPKSIYYRYLFSRIVDKTIDKILYIDSDIIVLKDISSLFSIDLKNMPLAACIDRNSDDITERNRIEIYDGIYFNSGVLLMNLKWWRDNDGLNSLTTFIKENPDKCLWPDQDALNIIFHNRTLILPTKFNFLISFTEALESLKLHKSKRKELIESSKDIIILHYATQDKPWYADSIHPIKRIWQYYYKKSPWRDIKLKKRRGFQQLLIDFVKYRILKWEMKRPSINREMNSFIESLISKYKQI